MMQFYLGIISGANSKSNAVYIYTKTITRKEVSNLKKLIKPVREESTVYSCYFTENLTVNTTISIGVSVAASVAAAVITKG